MNVIETHVFESAVKQFITENLPPTDDTNIDSDKYVTPTFVILRKQDILVMPSDENENTALFVEFEAAAKVGPRPFTEDFDYYEYVDYNLNYGFINNSTGFQEMVSDAENKPNKYFQVSDLCGEYCDELCATDVIPWVFFGVMCIILLCTLIWVYRRHCKKENNVVEPAYTEESFQICPSNSSTNPGMVLRVKPCAEGMDVRKCSSNTCRQCSVEDSSTEMVAVSPKNGRFANWNWNRFLASPRNSPQRISTGRAETGSTSDDS